MKISTVTRGLHRIVNILNKIGVIVLIDYCNILSVRKVAMITKRMASL